MALQVDIFRVEHGDGFSMPCISMLNRRVGGAPRMLRWICQRHLEILLFNRGDGGSSVRPYRALPIRARQHGRPAQSHRSSLPQGAIWKALSNAGLDATSLCVNRKAMRDGFVLEAELAHILQVFKDALPADVCDPCSLGRIRSCTLLPIATAAVVCRSHGRSPASLAWLRAFSQPVPDAWLLHEQAEADEAANQVDLKLQEKLEQLEGEQHFEAEELSFAQELQQMPTFSAVADDEERMKTYTMQRVPPLLKKELGEYIVYRTSTFAARRQGGAVQSISAEGDKASARGLGTHPSPAPLPPPARSRTLAHAPCAQTALLRFFGYLQRQSRVPVGVSLETIAFMIRADLGDLVQAYATWLQSDRNCKFTTIANYLNGLVGITSYCYAMLEPADAVLNMEPNPLAQIINLRSQAEKASKTQNMYDKRVLDGWLTWEDVQNARVAAVNKLGEAEWGSPEEKRFALRDAAALSLLSLIPPDRVGCIRKLRLCHTLKKKELGPGWKMDLSKQRDGHKTSRFYGPFAASLPSALTPILDQYCAVLELEPGSDAGPYLFHPPQSHFDRPMESSAWSAWVKRLFKRHHGEEVAPKTLRSVFITWLRDTTTTPEILKSAAHAMKHSEARQASGDYDQEADDRLVKAAYDFNLSFASQFEAEAAPPAGAGSSAAHGAAPAPSPRSLPNRAGREAGMAAARAMASPGGAARAAAPAPPPPVPPPPPARRCNFADCTADSPTEGLRECACGNGPHHHFCSIAAGCEDDASRCAICLGKPVFAPSEEAAVAEDGGAGQAIPVNAPALNDEQIAARMAELRVTWVDAGQSEMRGAVETDIDAVHSLLNEMGADVCTLLTPELTYVFERSIHGERRLNCTTHAPDRLVDDDGEWEPLQDEWQPLEGGPWVAKLMRPSRQPVAHATYRNFYVTSAQLSFERPHLPLFSAHQQIVRSNLAHTVGFDPDTTPLLPGGKVKFPCVAGAPAEGIVCTLPQSWSGRDKSFVFRLKLSKNGCAANEVTINQVLFRGPVLEEDGEGESGGEGGGEGDGAASVVPLAQVPAAALAAAAAPADAEAESTVSDGAADAIQMAARAADLETNLSMPEAPAGSMAALAREALVRSDGALPGEGDAVVESPSAGPPPAEHADAMAAVAANDAVADDGMLASAPPLSPPPAPEAPPPAPPASLPPSRAGRERKRKAFFGDAGELDGAASSFRSAPMDRKASVDPSEEMGVPAYAIPGSEVLAMGLHAGVRKRFKATVTGLRKQFPRIVVKYTATEDGGKHPLELPDPVTAYLTMSDVEPGTLVMA